MKLGFSVNLQIDNLCFCLRYKIKHNQGCLNKEYAIFEHIRLSGPIPEVKSALINDYKNIACSEESQAKQGVGE